jgi:hypothetical protein
VVPIGVNSLSGSIAKIDYVPENKRRKDQDKKIAFSEEVIVKPCIKANNGRPIMFKRHDGKF